MNRGRGRRRAVSWTPAWAGASTAAPGRRRDLPFRRRCRRRSSARRPGRSRRRATSPARRHRLGRSAAVSPAPSRPPPQAEAARWAGSVGQLARMLLLFTYSCKNFTRISFFLTQRWTIFAGPLGVLFEVALGEPARALARSFARRDTARARGRPPGRWNRARRARARRASRRRTGWRRRSARPTGRSRPAPWARWAGARS
jgi:hypothetical protein